MKKTNALAVLAALSVLGCSGSKGTDEAISDTFSDTQALAEAESAANEIVRNATDCDAVTRSYSEVTAKLDEVEGRIQTAVGRTTLETLKKQVRTIGEACGAR